MNDLVRESRVELFMASEGRTLVQLDANPVDPALAPTVRLRVGIDAAITANHHMCLRRVGPDGAASTSRFLVPPTLAGLGLLSDRLAAFPDVMAVAEPTSMSWLPLAVAVEQAGGRLSLVGSRHAARLRGAISGKNKSDVITG